jgi:hypothetical protein
MVGLLQESDQIPPEKQPIETGVKHPVKLWRRKVPEDMVSFVLMFVASSFFNVLLSGSCKRNFLEIAETSGALD